MSDTPSPKVRCKMIVTNKNNTATPYRQPSGAQYPFTCTVRLQPAPGDENATWSRHTPGGHIELSITNPAAYDAFVLGQAYFVDFTPAPFAEEDETP